MLLLLLMATKLLVIIILVHPRTYTLFVAPFARGGGRKEMQERIKVRMRERGFRKFNSSPILQSNFPDQWLILY